MQRVARGESRPGSRDTRCSSCITIDDDDAATDGCRSLSSSPLEAAAATDINSRLAVSSQQYIDDIDTRHHHLVSLSSSDSSDVDDFVLDDVTVGNDCDSLCSHSKASGDPKLGAITCGQWSPGRSHERRQIEFPTTMATGEHRVELHQLDPCPCVCEQPHRSKTAERRQRNNRTQEQNNGGGLGRIVVTCYSDDQRDIIKTTAKSRRLGVVKTTIESRSLGLVETTVKLDGCPLVRTTLDCRDLDLSETKLYSEELGVLKTTLRSGHDASIKSSVYENTVNDIDNAEFTYHNPARKIDNKNVHADRLMHGKQQVCTIKAEPERSRRAVGRDTAVNITEHCGCNRAGRRIQCACAEHQFSDDSDSGYIARRIRELPVIVARYGTLSHERNQDNLHELIASRQVLADDKLTSVPLLSCSSGENTARVQSGDVSSTSSSLSGDDMLIIDSLSDDDVITDLDAAGEDKMHATDVDVQLTTVTSASDYVADTTLRQTTTTTYLDVRQPDLYETFQDLLQDDKNKETDQPVEQHSQHAAAGQEVVSVDVLINSETAKLSHGSKSDVGLVAVKMSEIADECSQRAVVKPCHVLLTRLGTESFSHPQQSTNFDLTATTVAASCQQHNSMCAADVRLTSGNIPTTAAFTSDVFNYVRPAEDKTAIKWQNELPNAAADSVHGTTAIKLRLSEYMASGEVCDQESSCDEVKGGTQLLKSLSNRSNRRQTILGVVKRSRNKTGGVQYTDETFTVKTRNKTTKATKRDENIQSEFLLHDTLSNNFGVNVSKIEPQVNPARYSVLSETSNLDNQQNGQSEVTIKCSLLPAVAASKSQPKRKVSPTLTRHSISSYHVDIPKQKRRRTEGFWNFSKQKRSLKRKNTSNKSFTVSKEQSSENSYCTLTDNIQTVNSDIEHKSKKCARQFTRGRQTTKAKAFSRKKPKPKGSKETKNITWEIAPLADQTAQDSNNTDIEGEHNTLRSNGSQPECKAIARGEDHAKLHCNSLYQQIENDGDRDELNIQRDPIIVRFRRHQAGSVLSSRQHHSDVMQQVIAEIRRVHRRLDFVLLQRRRRRQCVTSPARTCAGAPAAPTTIPCDPCSISTTNDNLHRALAPNTSSDVKVSEDSVGLRGALTEAGAMWPVRVLIAKSMSVPCDTTDADTVEILLCATEQRSLQVGRVLAYLASSASCILFAPGLLACPTQLLLKETQLAGDASRIPAIESLAAANEKKKKRRRRARQATEPASEQRTFTNGCGIAATSNRHKQEVTNLRRITDNEDSYTPAEASTAARQPSGATSTAAKSARSDDNYFQLSRTIEDADCTIIECPASTGSRDFSEHLQVYATPDGQCLTQTSATIASISQTSVSVSEASPGFGFDRSKTSNQRPKSVGASRKRRESTPHRPGWNDWQTSANYVQRPPTMSQMSRQYPMYYQSPASQLTSQFAGQSRSCATPRDHGMSRVLPTLSLFDTELDLSECELLSHCGDDNADIDELATVPNYQYPGSAQQAAWTRSNMVNPLLMKPEARHPHDVVIPPHLQSRDYGLYPSNQFYNAAWSANSAGSSHRQYRPRSRSSTWWSVEPEQPAPANYAWSPYSQYNRYHHHYHPYQR